MVTYLQSAGIALTSLTIKFVDGVAVSIYNTVNKVDDCTVNATIHRVYTNKSVDKSLEIVTNETDTSKEWHSKRNK